MKLLTLVTGFFLITILHLSFGLSAADNQAKPNLITYCAPQNNVYPFFIADNDQLSGINPDLMRHVFASEALTHTTLQFVKRPWKRCNADLENGQVDMMIGGFDANRENVVYPDQLGFELQTSMVSTAKVCFSSIAGRQMDNVVRGLENGKPFSVGIEAGFSKQHSKQIRPQWLVLFNPVEKFRMLKLGRIDAIVQVCAMDDDFAIETKAETAGFTEIKTIYPPYLSNPAYIIFSQQFANNNQGLAKLIIQVSSKIDKAKVYENYKPSKLINPLQNNIMLP